MSDNGKITKEQAHLYGAAKHVGIEMSAEDIENTLENAPEIDWPMIIAIFCLLAILSIILGYIIWFLFFHFKLMRFL